MDKVELEKSQTDFTRLCTRVFNSPEGRELLEVLERMFPPYFDPDSHPNTGFKMGQHEVVRMLKHFSEDKT